MSSLVCEDIQYFWICCDFVCVYDSEQHFVHLLTEMLALSTTISTFYWMAADVLPLTATYEPIKHKPKNHAMTNDPSRYGP